MNGTTLLFSPFSERPALRWLPILFVGLFVAACPAVEEEAAEAPAAVERSIGDENALNSLVAEYMVAVNDGDADAVAALYAANGILLPPDALPVSGRESIRQRAAGIFEGADIEMQLQVEETRFSGELAYVRGTFARTVTPKGGAETTDSEGNSEGNWMRLMRREPDGRWLVASELWNTRSEA